MIYGILLAAAVGSPAAPGLHGEVRIRDCSGCPQMIVLEGGRALLGAPAREPGRYANELPRAWRAVAPFAIGQSEVTRGQFAEFVRAARYEVAPGCFTPGDLEDWVSDIDPRASWREPGFDQTDEHPAVCISWVDARAYAQWLSQRTGHRYRLPTDLEWEYAVRAGTGTAYFWGDRIEDGCKAMNGGDAALARAVPKFAQKTREYFESGVTKSVMVRCDDGNVFTSAAGSYLPNGFGLFDMTGNAWEWVEDCADEAETVGPPCSRRRTRGGSWNDWPIDLRSSVRKRLEPSARRNDVGFRVVRELAANDLK